MAYTNVYPNRINWENEPSINTPINETNLNKMDYALYQHDRTLENWDTTKANQSDLLLSVKTIDYDTETGVFVFTWQNGTTKTVDLNIEKIPVNFSMSPQGVITMTTDDGTTYTADVGALIKTYTFNDSSVIDFTVVTDASGNKTITADIVDGSITGTKLQPNYLADCTAAKIAAENAETGAEDSAEDAEAWAVGERNGVPVDPSDPTYHNNSKYWSQQANPTTLEGLTDTDINDPEDGQVLTFNGTSEKWENADPAAGGMTSHIIVESDAGESSVTVTLPSGTVKTCTQVAGSTTQWETTSDEYGTHTIDAYKDGDDAQASLNIQYVGEYIVHDEHYYHTINVTVMSGASIIVTGNGETYSGVGTGSAVAFAVHGKEATYTVTTSVDGVSAASQTVTTPATSGQSTSLTFQYGTINLTYANDFRGASITCTDGNKTITKTAPNDANAMTFYPPNTGTWEIIGVYSGVTYSTGSITVSSLSTAVSATLQTIPDGSTATPINDVQILLNCAGIFDKNYTTISQLLADSTSLLTVISDNNAVDYLVRSTGFATDICANSTAMTDIGANNYCANTLLADSTWSSAICNSTYFESVLNVKVPTMTSDTTPSGEAFIKDQWGGNSYAPWHAFDGSSLTRAIATNPTGDYASFGYIFTRQILLRKVYVSYTDGNSGWQAGMTYIQGSNDGNTWTDIGSININTYPFTGSVNISTNTKYSRYRLQAKPGNSSGVLDANIVQFYGR